jgi:RNA-binding protein
MTIAKIMLKLKKEISSQKPTIWIGKDGITTQILKEVTKQLDSREMIKVKILKSALKNKKVNNIAFKIAEETESKLIDMRGHTFLLFKKTRKK